MSDKNAYGHGGELVVVTEDGEEIPIGKLKNASISLEKNDESE